MSGVDPNRPILNFMSGQQPAQMFRLNNLPVSTPIPTIGVLPTFPSAHHAYGSTVTPVVGAALPKTHQFVTVRNGSVTVGVRAPDSAVATTSLAESATATTLTRGGRGRGRGGGRGRGTSGGGATRGRGRGRGGARAGKRRRDDDDYDDDDDDDDNARNGKHDADDDDDDDDDENGDDDDAVDGADDALNSDEREALRLGAQERASGRRAASKTKRYNYDAEYDDEDDIFGDKVMEEREREARTSRKKAGPRIDRILSDRANPDTGVGEFLVKWQGRSYMHTEWVTEERIVELEKMWGRKKIERYFGLKPQLEAEADENGGPFDPDFTTIERVCAIKEVEMATDDEASDAEADFKIELDVAAAPLDAAATGGTAVDDLVMDAMAALRYADAALDNLNDDAAGTTAAAAVGGGASAGTASSAKVRVKREPRVKTRVALIKWMSLPYTDASWEQIDALDGVEEHLERFRRWNQYPPVMKNQTPYKKFTESPVFKDNHTLRAYQLEGLNWLLDCWSTGRGSILADEMGLGKTVQAVATLDWIRQHTTGRMPMLVLSPLSTMQHWAREFVGWTDLNVVTYQGTAAARLRIREYEFFYLNDDATQRNMFTKFDVLLTSYEMITNDDWTELAALPWQVIVVDEAQRLKNIDSKLARNLRAFKSSHRILLTGTPLQNNITELWTLLNFIEPAKFNALDDFLGAFGTITSSEQVQELHRVLQPYLLRRLKEDVEKSIPAKEEIVMNVELTRVQKQYYRAILDRNRTFLSKGCTGGNVPNLLNIMMQLRKLCCHPYLIEGVEDRDMQGVPNAQYIDRLISASGKLVFVDKLLPRLFEGKHKVLIFSQMIRVLDLLQIYLNARGYKYERLDGGVRGQDRQSAIDRFCKPESDRFVFLLCTRAGGVGINLTAADTVIIFDSDWNPQNDIQAQARCHRIGQKNKVSVYRLITGRTYEEEMFDRSSKKLGLDHAVLQSGRLAGSVGNVDRPRLSNKEVDQLLRHGAYHVFQDDDKAADEFTAANIDELLQRTKKVVWEEGGEVPEGHQSSTFSKATFQVRDDADEDVAIDDNNFWAKVMPEQKTPTTLLAKLQENEDALLKDKASRVALLRDINELVYEAADAWAKGKGEQPTGADELTHLITLCLSRPGWSMPEKQNMTLWLEQLDTTRRRRGRGQKPIAMMFEAADEAYDNGAANASGGGGDDDDDDDDDGSDDDDDDEGDRRRKRRRGARGGATAVAEAKAPSSRGGRRKAAAPVDKTGQWTDGERQRFIETLFDIGAPNYALFRLRLEAPQRSDAELYELARHVLQRCAQVTSSDDDRLLFRQRLEQFIAHGRSVASAFAGNERDLPPPPELATDKFVRNATRLCSSWARRLRELDRTAELWQRLGRGTLELPAFAVTPWWKHEHDVALIDGVMRLGLRAFQRIALEPAFAPFANRSDNRPADPAQYPGSKVAPDATLATVLDVHHTLLLKYLGAVDLAAQRDARARAAAELVTASDVARQLMREGVWTSRVTKALYNAAMRHGDADAERLLQASSLPQVSSDGVARLLDVLFFRANEVVQQRRTAAIEQSDADELAASALTYADACRCDTLFDLSMSAPNEAAQAAAMVAAAGASKARKRAAPDTTAIRELLFWLTEAHARSLIARAALRNAVKALVESDDFVARVAATATVNSMPAWWLPGVHDVLLLRGVLAHGFGGPAWAAALADDACAFYKPVPGAAHTVAVAECRRFLLEFAAADAPTALTARVLRVVRLAQPRHIAIDDDDDDPAADFADVGTPSLGRIAMMYERPVAGAVAVKTEPLSLLGAVASSKRAPRRAGGHVPRMTVAAEPLVKVQRMADGRPVLPLQTKHAEVMAIGQVRAGSKWHSRQYIWPEGFQSRRQLPCWHDHTTLRYYTTRIADNGSGVPVFRVSHEDGGTIENSSAAGVWRDVLSRIRGHDVSCSGPDMVGLSDPVVKALIQELQGARQCALYTWVDFGPAAGVAFGERYVSHAAATAAAAAASSVATANGNHNDDDDDDDDDDDGDDDDDDGADANGAEDMDEDEPNDDENNDSE